MDWIITAVPSMAR